MRILVVDDDEIALEILRSGLQASGYQVQTASDGQVALERIQQGGIQLVISDWEMPNMDGLALCRAVRQQMASGYIYLILLTSHGGPEQTVMGMSAGADDFIVKPFHQAELTARVRAGERVLAIETREMVIFALAKLAESRDSETGFHVERVQQYSRRLAESLRETSTYRDRVDLDFIRLVYQTSPLHDIGKVGIPDAVLQKPGRLTIDEFEIMKRHASIGAETLDAALSNYPQARFLQVARDIASSHHERWDGRGYPKGLAGESIPLAARIVAVADVYDALTSKRVYKPAYTHEVARELLVEGSGTQFDPELIEAFLRVESDFIKIGRQLAENEDCQHAAVIPKLPTIAVTPTIPLPETV